MNVTSQFDHGRCIEKNIKGIDQFLCMCSLSIS